MAGRSGGYRGRRNSEPRIHPPHESDKTTMLSLGRISAFRYDIREIMSHYRINEAEASTVMASVIAKASRISIDAARDYVREQEKTGIYPREALDEICNLVVRYSKLR